MGTKGMRMYIMSAICEYQLQLILPSIGSVFNVFIYWNVLKVEIVYYIYVWLCKTWFLENKSVHLNHSLYHFSVASLEAVVPQINIYLSFLPHKLKNR